MDDKVYIKVNSQHLWLEWTEPGLLSHPQSQSVMGCLPASFSSVVLIDAMAKAGERQKGR